MAASTRGVLSVRSVSQESRESASCDVLVSSRFSLVLDLPLSSTSVIRCNGCGGSSGALHFMWGD